MDQGVGKAKRPGHHLHLEKRREHRNIDAPVLDQPWVNARATHRIADQANGNVPLLIQIDFSGKIECHGREPADVVRGANFPRAFDRAKRVGSDECSAVIHPHPADAGIVGGGDIAIVAAAKVMSHVRLPAADPDVAHHHVGDAQRVGSSLGDGHGGPGGLGCHRIERQAPVALGVGGRGLRLTVENHRNFLARRGGAPDWARFAAL